MSSLKKIRNESQESKFGYVYAVSGPGMIVQLTLNLKKKKNYCRNVVILVVSKGIITISKNCERLLWLPHTSSMYMFWQLKNLMQSN